MANQIIVPERRIEVVGDNGYSRRDFLGLAGRLGAGILAASMSFGALDGLVGSEENMVYAQGKNGKKKSAKLKWKDYRNPEKATITYDPETDRPLSKEFIEWDMKGYGSPILKEEPDLPAKILEIGEELKVDPAVIISYLKVHTNYGKYPDCVPIKSPWGIATINDTSNDRRYKTPNGKEFIIFPTWAEGIKTCWRSKSNLINFSDGFPQPPYLLKEMCKLIRQMQAIDELLDKKTKEGKEYDIKLWKQMWDKAKKEIK